MPRIKYKLPGERSSRKNVLPIKGFKESKTLFGKVHNYLIKVKIIDGSSDSLVEDLLDSKLGKKEALEVILDRVSGITKMHSKIEKLVYIALGGFYKLEISIRIRRLLSAHFKECKTAIEQKDYDFGNTLIKADGEVLDDEILEKAIRMRMRAIQTVLALHGEHFLKRAYHVSSGWKIPLADVRK